MTLGGNILFDGGLHFIIGVLFFFIVDVRRMLIATRLIQPSEINTLFRVGIDGPSYASRNEGRVDVDRAFEASQSHAPQNKGKRAQKVRSSCPELLVVRPRYQKQHHGLTETKIMALKTAR